MLQRKKNSLGTLTQLMHTEMTFLIDVYCTAHTETCTVARHYLSTSARRIQLSTVYKATT